MADFNAYLGLPIQMARVELDITRPLTFKHFFHGNVVRGLLINLLKENERQGDHGLAPGIVPIVLENGFLTYHSGDSYVFGIVFLGNGLSLIEKFRERLSTYISRPVGVLQLGINAKLKDYSILDEINLLHLFTRLKKNQPDSFTIRFLTPMAIDREKADRLPGHARYDQQLFRIDIFLKKIIDRFNNLCQIGVLPLSKITLPTLPCEILKLNQSQLMWIELPTNRRQNTYGGVVGQLQVTGVLDDFWLMALLTGALLHVGEKINFGFGFYDLPGWFTDVSQLFRPQRSFVDLAIKENILLEAFNETKSNSVLSGVDEISMDEFEDQYDFWLQNLQNQIKNQTYEPPPLKGLVVKSNQKLRALTVPAILDRWLQRAVLKVVAPVLDTLFEDCSYAYRRNYSRQQAQAAIRQAYNDGYRYVLEADIENFFDEVEWEILMAKLRALFPFDPVVDLFEKWIKAPVMFRQKLIQRKKGLPQGAVVSPVLSNLYLDEFDEAIQNAGFRLIRFADDFVILCKSKKQAEASLKAVRQALNQLDLELKESKPRITHFDEGFRYLGYLFCRSVVLETLKEKDERPLDWALFDESKIPPNSWLANAQFNGQTLNEFLKSKRRQLFDWLFLKRDRNISVPQKRTIYLGSYQIKLKVKNNQLQIIHFVDGEPKILNKIPLHTIQQVILLGPVPLTMPALFKLLNHQIPVMLATSKGKPLASIFSLANDLSLWIKQHEKFSNSEFQVSFSRAIVMAKINNYLMNLRFAQWPEKELCLNELSQLKNICLNKNSVNSIRGIEGRAAAIFYKNYGYLLGEAWNFTHRRKHPPIDAINALLSLGYTILYNYLTCFILGQGLNPQIGIYHKAQSGFNALSSDLQEEFRFLIDRLILTLINRKQLKVKDCQPSEKQSGFYLLNKKVKKLFIEQLEKKLNEVIFWRAMQSEMSYLQIMEFQAHQIKQIVLDKQSEYQPFFRR